MNALLFTEYKKLDYVDFPTPQIGQDEILIEVKATVICDSNIPGYDGSSSRRIPPLIMGRETAGVIADVGDKVSKWKPGDRVTCDSTVK